MSRYTSPDDVFISGGLPTIEEESEDKLLVVDLSTNDLLIEVLTTLKKIEFHLSVASGTELND